MEMETIETPLPLTSIQAKVLDAIRRRIEHGESAPTYRDLCEEFGWASTGTARDHLKALARKGVLELSQGLARQLRVKEHSPGATRVPLIGRIVAGTPLVAEENIESRIAVPADWVKKGTHFCLRVSGESMKDAGIFEGDLVLVRKQKTAKEGEIVVATVEGETTLKRLHQQKGRSFLLPENAKFKPIEIRSESAQIQGVVVGLLRFFAQ